MSSTLLSAGDAEAPSIRPRNRRLISIEADGPPPGEPSSMRGTARLASRSPTPFRDASPVPSDRLDVGPPPEAVSRRSPSRGRKSSAGFGFGAGLLDGSWASSWNSVQDLAAGWLSGGTDSRSATPRRQRSRADSRDGRRQHGEYRRATSRPWAQESRAATSSRPTILDVGAGVMADREAALTAAKTASVLESHAGVNGGLDVAGRYKLRTSDDVSRQSSDAAAAADVEEVLAYIHHVQPADTYAGIILKYGCREDQFRKANGLWSRDGISTRKWVALPVDACDVKGRPCAAPSSAGEEKVDLLAPTPTPVEEADDYGWRGTTTVSQQHAEDIFGPPHTNGSAATTPEDTKPAAAAAEDAERPWTHVRWVSLDTVEEPVEIGRVSRKTFGYFRPRRKQSFLSTMSTLSTPRPSIDVQSTTQASVDGADNRGCPSSRRQSLLSNRPTFTGGPGAGVSTPTSTSTRSRMGSVGADARPAWMRQPGGIGSMARSVRAPGPEKDPLNSWATKHFPALIPDSLPSMSVTAEGGGGGGGAIAEMPFGGAVDLSRQGTGLDRAAAAVETWLRGALAKRPGTPTTTTATTTRGEWGGLQDSGDLIELTDAQSDDGTRMSGRVESSLSLTSLPGLRGNAAAGGASGGGVRTTTRAARRGKNKDD